jgi:transposase
MSCEQHRHDISDHMWSLLESHLPGRKGSWGGKAQDNRRFINGIFWILRTGAPWRDLPPTYGDWKNTHRRFCRWRDKGIWEGVLAHLVDEPDYEWLMIDASHIKVHSDAECGFFYGCRANPMYRPMGQNLVTIPSSARGMQTP